MLTLLTFPGDSHQPSFSPFCLKAMCLLHLSGQDWQPKFVGNPAKMPYRRLPVLKTAERLIPDSHNIQTYLESHGADFNAGLGTDDLARSHALIRMVEENLRCGLVYDRWLNDEVWPHFRVAVFTGVPFFFRKIIPSIVRKSVRRAMLAQGIAQFPPEDRLDRLSKDVGAIAQALGDKDYLFGAAPTAADAATLPVLDMISTLPVDTDLRQLVRDNPKLMSYIKRARAVLYPT